MNDQLHVVCPSCNAVNRLPRDRLDQHPVCGSCHGALFSGKPLELDGTSFERHITRNDVPVLVDFWAPWCGPCRMMAPAYEQATAELEPRLRLAKLNTDDHGAVAQRFSIRGIPTLILFVGGREKARQSGAMPLQSLLSWVRPHLSE